MTTKPTTTKTMTTLGDRATTPNPIVFDTGVDTIRWCQSRAPGLHNQRAHAQESIERLPDGRRVRHPQHAHLYETGPKGERIEVPNAASRYMRVLDSIGGMPAAVLTNGASIIPRIEAKRFSRDMHVQSVLDKCNALAWLPVDECPVTVVREGRANPRRILAREIVSPAEAPCSSSSFAEPCRHLLAEQAARQGRNAIAMEKLEAATRRVDPAIAIARGVATALRAERELEDAAPKRKGK